MKISKFLFLLLLSGQFANSSEVGSAEAKSAVEAEFEAYKSNSPYEITGTIISVTLSEVNEKVLHIKCGNDVYVPTNIGKFPDLKEGLKATFKVQKTSADKMTWFEGTALYVEILEIKENKEETGSCTIC